MIVTLDYIDIKLKSYDVFISLQNDNNFNNKFNQFAGMWQGRYINTHFIRQKAWKK